MRIRLPLYGKILGWFFLNLFVVAGVVVLLFDAQFHFNLDWFFSTGGRERMEAMRDLIVDELNNTEPDEWRVVMRRYSAAHHVDFALFDDDGRPLVGDVTELPDEVKKRINTWPSFSPPRRRDDRAPSAPPAARTPEPNTQRKEGGERRGPRFPVRPPLRALMRTTHPTYYWVLTSARLDNPMFGDAMRVILVTRSNYISAGGLILNPKPWLYLGIGVVVFSLLFWFPLVRSITRTLARMTQATRQIADGRFDVRMKMTRRDELGYLAESINQMAARLDGLMQGQKQFLGDIAHELCSPLARLQMALGILEQYVDDKHRSYALSASEKAAQIATLVNELLSFSKAAIGASTVQLQPVSVLEVAREAQQREWSEGAEIHARIPEAITVLADADRLARALANLLRNAIRYAGADGPIVITASEAGQWVTISVADHGPGVPEEELPKIFDAFYRLDPSRNRETGGTGLGLTIVKTCIESCGGTVSARCREPHGLEIVIRLPSVTGAG